MGLDGHHILSLDERCKLHSPLPPTQRGCPAPRPSLLRDIPSGGRLSTPNRAGPASSKSKPKISDSYPKSVGRFWMALFYVELTLVTMLSAFLFKLLLPYLVMGILVYMLRTLLREILEFLGYPQSRVAVIGEELPRRTGRSCAGDIRGSQQVTR